MDQHPANNIVKHDPNTRVRKRSIFSIVVLGVGLMLAHIVQQSDNLAVKKDCKGVYTLGSFQTGVGPVFVCKSSVQVYGPATPIKD